MRNSYENLEKVLINYGFDDANEALNYAVEKDNNLLNNEKQSNDIVNRHRNIEINNSDDDFNKFVMNENSVTKNEIKNAS